jgi:hypothetical protein
MLPVLYRNPSRDDADVSDVTLPASPTVAGDALDVAETFLVDARAAFVAALAATNDRARARAHAANTYQDAVRDWSVAYLNEFPCRAAGDLVRDVLRVGIETISRWGR